LTIPAYIIIVNQFFLWIPIHENNNRPIFNLIKNILQNP
jgi:hypothetical protein